MGTSVSLGGHFQGFVKELVESGRYNNVSEAVRDGLRMMEMRDRRLAAIEQALEQGLNDEATGHLKTIDDVANRLVTKYTRLTPKPDKA